MDYFSYHNHTSYCDGKFSPENYILRAIEFGMTSMGFSSHAPLNGDFAWCMKETNVNKYVDEIRALQKKYQSQIAIYLSLEIDYIPGITKSFKEWKGLAKLDYTVGSVHLVKKEGVDDLWVLDGPEPNYIKGMEDLFNGNAQEAVTAYYHQVNDMIISQKPDIVGHIDKIKMNNKRRFFSGEEKWYKNLLDETLDVVEKSESIIEVNTRGMYKGKTQDLFPDGYFLRECSGRNIPVTISTDAHSPDELISGFDVAKLKLKELGFNSVRFFDHGKWIEQNL